MPADFEQAKGLSSNLTSLKGFPCIPQHLLDAALIFLRRAQGDRRFSNVRSGSARDKTDKLIMLSLHPRLVALGLFPVLLFTAVSQARRVLGSVLPHCFNMSACLSLYELGVLSLIRVFEIHVVVSLKNGAQHNEHLYTL